MAFPGHFGNLSNPLLTRKLLQREIDPDNRPWNIRSLNGDRSWIGDIDIVNELAGHRGCVNALSWSKSGRLLASGSDDTNLIIHRYQPENSTRPFTLATCLSTGHRANIFSVKFMPHSNDNTLVSCAGDHEVRVFDLEYSGRTTETADDFAAASTRAENVRRGIAALYPNATYLTDGNTDSRVYRSHSDRVKRIVTESSPHLFLTCSEDGEVRQFDLRLPSSAYPRQSNPRTVVFDAGSQTAGSAPAPLISYKKYNLDLNSISCSASQPHYIVLGGAHLHCFLHDRRMLGRDVLEERGSRADSDMGTATRCVRRFAPNGKTRMSSRGSGHVTACKISDRNPNEMIASWSGDHIYAFNLIQPDENKPREQEVQKKSTQSKDRKRKSSSQGRREEDVVIRMHYENGQTEDIPLAQDASQRFLNQARESVLTDAQKRSARIAKSLVRIRDLLFSMDHGSDLASLKPALSEVLGLSSSTVQEMDGVMRDWRYPVDPEPEEVVFQTTLRQNRDATRQFVQACGTLARVLGGKLNTAGASPLLGQFDKIKSSELEHNTKNRESIFRYGFLRVILLWLEDKRMTLADIVQNRSGDQKAASGSDLTEEDGIGEICRMLESQVATLEARQVVNVDHSRFETDALRIVFATEADAVRAFSGAVRIPFDEAESTASTTGLNKELAAKFWGLRVCRSILMNAGEHINFAFADRAFGGLGTSTNTKERSQQDIELDSAASEKAMTPESIQMSEDESINSEDREGLLDISDLQAELDGEGEDEEEDLHNLEEPHTEERNDFDDDDDDNDDDMGDEDEEVEGDEDEDVMDAGIFFRGSSERNALRALVNKDIPCNSHIRSYRGHCNVKTVKDVNYFGLDDEYVVSGCDSGHLFIWDAKTCKLLNILKGDTEVVNVVQGHPYEPTLAVSGIDHTIKIFSPDRRAQHDARKGINLGLGPDESSGTSTLRYGQRTRPARSDDRQPASNPDGEDLSSDDTLAGGLASRKRMRESYSITSQNDLDRAGGNREAFITRHMLSQLARMMALRRAGRTADDDAGIETGAGADADEEDGDGDGDGDAGADAEHGAALQDRCATM